MHNIILASSSPRRKELLEISGYEFKVINPSVNENQNKTETPIEYATRISKEKCLAISKENPNAIVLAADTIVVLGDQIIGKPKDFDDSVRILNLLSGKTHSVFTSFTLNRLNPSTQHCGLVKTAVSFKILTDSEISAYTKSKEGMDKAGAYGIQNSAIRFIEKIEGSPSNVIGLPLVEVIQALTKFYD